MHGLAIARVVNLARARRRMEQLRQHAAEGHELRESAEAVGLSRKGAMSLLRKFTGSSAWPPQESAA